MESTDIKIARIENEIGHIKDDMAEMKTFTRQTHEKIDGISLKIQELGGLTQMIYSVQTQVNQNTKWIAEHSEFVQELRAEKKDTKRRIKDFAFKWGFNLLMFVIVLYLYVSLQHANNTLIQTLEKGIVIEQVR